ncbi:SLBB domain-containing protein [Synechococcus sp. ATX 2A4]|nr:SLBB domain-containing protein [Synechococcus sp. ATX 2A4]
MRYHWLKSGLLPLCLVFGAVAAPEVAAQPSAGASSGFHLTAAGAPPPGGRAAFRYKLGPGDRLRMQVFKVEGYAADVEVLSDGTINLPRIGSLSVWGLTLNQAKDAITKSYSTFLRQPIVFLDLLAPRPVRVAVTGQVQRPGLYAISRSGTNQLSAAGTEAPVTAITTSGWPTLVDAIQRAGGITATGNLGSVTITRPGTGIGAPPVTQTYDFLSVLRHGTNVENPLIYDGDTVTVGRATDISNEDLLTTASSTFAPDTITVNVIGEVTKPGPQQVKANSPLAQAIVAAGGTTRRASQSTIQLLRLEPDGTVTATRLAYSPTEVMGSSNNPPLRSGDVVVVDRNGWTKFNDGLGTFVQPVGPVLNAASILRLLGAF